MKGFSYLEVLISMAIWALVSLFFLSLVLRSVRNMRIANEDLELEEASRRAAITKKGNYKKVVWKKTGEFIELKRGKRRIFLKEKFMEGKNEKLRLFPR